MITIEERKAKYLLWLEEVMAMQPALRQELADDFEKRLKALEQDLKKDPKTVKTEAIINNLKKLIEDRTRTAVAWMNLYHEAEGKLKLVAEYSPEGAIDPRNPFPPEQHTPNYPEGWVAYQRIPEQVRFQPQSDAHNPFQYIYLDVPCECQAQGFCPRHTALGAVRHAGIHGVKEDPQTDIYQCDKCRAIFKEVPMAGCPYCQNKNFIPTTLKEDQKKQSGWQQVMDAHGIPTTESLRQRIEKIKKVEPTEEKTVHCQNCGEGVILRGTCIRCGQSERIGDGKSRE